MSGHTRKDKMKNECIREKIGVTLIKENIADQKLTYKVVWSCEKKTKKDLNQKI